MAKRIIRLPGRMSIVLLRLAGTAITFLFAFFVYASGQIVSAGRSLVRVDVSAISPAYGIVMYGPPITSSTIKGTIRSAVDSTPLKNAKIVVQDTAAGQTIDSGFTADSGSYSMTFNHAVGINSWVLEVRDSLYITKDTLISFPANGNDTLNVDLYLQKMPLMVRPAGSNVSQAPSLLAGQEAKGSIETRYTLQVAGRAHLALYAATGRLVREFFDRSESAGEHQARLETSGLPAGIYFLKLQTGTHAAITRIPLER